MGLEPTRSLELRILSPLRIPLPPPGRVLHAQAHGTFFSSGFRAWQTTAHTAACLLTKTAPLPHRRICSTLSARWLNRRRLWTAPGSLVTFRVSRREPSAVFLTSREQHLNSNERHVIAASRETPIGSERTIAADLETAADARSPAGWRHPPHPLLRSSESGFCAALGTPTGNPMGMSQIRSRRADPRLAERLPRLMLAPGSASSRPNASQGGTIVSRPLTSPFSSGWVPPVETTDAPCTCCALEIANPACVAAWSSAHCRSGSALFSDPSAESAGLRFGQRPAFPPLGRARWRSEERERERGCRSFATASAYGCRASRKKTGHAMRDERKDPHDPNPLK